TAEQAQGSGRLVLGTQRPPSLTVGAQGIGQAPGIVAIGLAAAGSFAPTILFGGQWINRIERVVALQQLIHSHADASFDGDWAFTERLHVAVELLPARGGVSELKVGDDGP